MAGMCTLQTFFIPSFRKQIVRIRGGANELWHHHDHCTGKFRHAAAHGFNSRQGTLGGSGSDHADRHDKLFVGARVGGHVERRRQFYYRQRTEVALRKPILPLSKPNQPTSVFHVLCSFRFRRNFRQPQPQKYVNFDQKHSELKWRCCEQVKSIEIQ